MEEQSWKGHSFTLLVFTGIVVLSSIFFILGMLVGRAQGQKIASAAAPAAAKTAPKEEDKPDFTFYDSVKKEQPASLSPIPAKPEPAPPAPTKSAAPLEQLPPVTSKPANVLNYQIGAVRKAADAERLLSDVKKKGFRGFILSPSTDESNPYFRVQVGPFKDPIEAEQAKKHLEAAGFKPMLKK